MSFLDFGEGRTRSRGFDPLLGRESVEVLEHDTDPPALMIEGTVGGVASRYWLPRFARVLVSEGDEVVSGTLLAVVPRTRGGVVNFRGGVPGLTELFEAQAPAEAAVLVETDGIVELEESDGRWAVVVRDERGSISHYPVPDKSVLRVQSGERVRVGDRLTHGSKSLHDVLLLEGAETVQRCLLDDLLGRFLSYKGAVQDHRHLEIVLRRMLRRVRVTDPGDTKWGSGELVDRFEFRDLNERARNEGRRPALAVPALVGVSAAAHALR